MSEFLTLLPPPEALSLLLNHLTTKPTAEWIPTADSLGRVTAAPVYAPFPLPTFARSTVDGYAVRARDTFGASESLPAYLTVAGEVAMGTAATQPLTSGQCQLIHTGGMLPPGADAVVMVEHTQEARAGEREILRTVAVGENVLQIGEDVHAGREVIPVGVRLRPAEIGGLMALGLAEVAVTRQPLIGILSSGDEVIRPGQPLQMGQVYDVNSYTLQALVAQAGGRAQLYPLLPDEPAAFKAAAEQAWAECDMLLFTAGSSVSARDLTAQTIAGLGAPGVLVHGVSVRPGKPTILAVCGGKPVIGLPGNPVSALIIAQILAVPVLERLLGLKQARPHGRITARLATNLPSQAGREDWVAVRLVPQADGTYTAEPIFGKSNLIFTLARADGLLRIPPAANGLPAGAEVAVELMQ